jgi:inosine-uridine nucleoside N-ribohydrolase
MKKAVKRILKRIFIFIVTVFVIYLVASNISLIRDLVRKDGMKIIMDTDAGYGRDDVFAVSRILMDPDIQVIGLLSSQWHYADPDNDSTLYLSHDINYKIVRVFNRNYIPRHLGGPVPIRFDEKPWSRSNQAARFIADRAMEVVTGEKLNVFCLGSTTNLATALLMKPEAASRIRCYMMGPLYEPSRRIWNKNEFNAQNDLDALDIIFNATDLELHIMPANLAGELVFTGTEARESLQGSDEVSKFLLSEFAGSSVSSDSVSMASLALVQALLNPELASEKKVFPPPENNQRKISVYTRIDTDRMKRDYWRSIKNN